MKGGFIIAPGDPALAPGDPAWPGGEGPVDWRRIFGREGPVEVEIGVGKGRFLLETAPVRPETNFLGFEIRRKMLRLADQRLTRRGVGNVRLLGADASSFVAQRIPPASVRAFHVYFPDPWPKRKHHKRRLLSPEFCRVLEKTLAPGGEAHVITDHDEYYIWILKAFAAAPGLRPAEPRPPHPGDGLTHFEVKYRRQGRSFHRGRWVKRVTSGPLA